MLKLAQYTEGSEERLGQKEFWNEIHNQTKKYYKIAFIVSGEILTFVLSLNYSVIIKYNLYSSDSYQVNISYALLATVLMLLIYWKLAYIKQLPQKVIENISMTTGWTAFLFAIVVCYRLLLDTQRNYDHIFLALGKIIMIDWDKYREISYNIVLPIVCIISFFSVFIFLLKTCDLIKGFLSHLYKTADISEKRYFIISLLEGLSLICFFYSKTWAQWNTLDIVYQTDSNFVYNHYYPVFSLGYDFDWDIGNGGIRHPLTTLYTYPIYVIVKFISNLLYIIPNIQPLLYAIVQTIMLILTVIMLKRIINSNWIYLIFNLSFPFTFFTIFIEKYQMATFFLVMFVYTVVKKKEKSLQCYSLIAASGTMITSAWLGFFYGKRKRLATRLREYVEIIENFFAVLIGAGRIIYLINFPYLINHNFEMFNGKKILLGILSIFNTFGIGAVGTSNQLIINYTSISLTDLVETVPKLIGKICAFFNLLASCLMPVPYGVIFDGYTNIFYWSGVKNEINILGVVIFVTIFITVIRHRKEKAIQIFAAWILWGIVQFIIVGFAASCSPLFSLYFAWAVISLLIIGLKDILKRPIQKLLGYGSIAFIMICANLIHLQQLYTYMLEVAPV
ncbi:MAG: hypothetical protein K2O16_00415 [Lachnospiraceae bacterium]|nr:hypothetical protein [Lachnospiraceae bacterium]